jgi:glutathione-specific gamma-glutamylcyclotransferase
MVANRIMHLTPELVARVQRSIPDTGPSPGFVPMEEEDYERVADDILREHPRHDDLWIFAYGSLMWRPACEVDGQEMALLNGWHRKFCIRIARWRGTLDNPGLMMEFDRGGSCRAVVQRLSAGTARDRFGQLLRRELTSKQHPTNRPRWVTVNAGDHGAGRSLLPSYDPAPITGEGFRRRRSRRFWRRLSDTGAPAPSI